MLLRRVGIALVAEHLKRIDQTRARLLRLDHIVNVAAFRRDIGAGKFLAVFRNQFGFLLHGVFCLFKFLAEDDIHRAVRSHHGDLGRGPRQVQVAADVLRGHDTVRAAIGLPRDHRQLRNGRFAIGIKQFRP